ncbi:MAG: DNA helicase RecQ [Magnetovibrionaceae bacterium]
MDRIPEPDEFPRLEGLNTLLQSVFGYEALHDGQRAVLDHVMAGRDVLAVMPTGAGKSMCFQLPALSRGGLTIVISPLIALMRDQVSALKAAGVSAGSLNSQSSPEDRAAVHEALRDGTLRLLYLSPERLIGEDTLHYLSAFPINMLAIDEAHCVSQWGHDFRPEYTRIREAWDRLRRPQVLALTATADPATRDDIARALFAGEPERVVTGFDRPNLRLAMAPKNSQRKQIEGFLKGRDGQCGIIYCTSRKQTESLAEGLSTGDRTVLAYHAGMEPDAREEVENRFQKEDGIIVTATVAFGMGIDKPDVRFVLHAGLPKSIEAYYQEIGRAGRDGLDADTLTLYGVDDIKLRRLQIDDSGLPEDRKRGEHLRLNALVALCEAPRCRRQTLLAYFGETQSEPCGKCDLCQEEVEVIDGSIQAQKALSAILRTGERFGLEHLINVLRGTKTDMIERWQHDKLPTFGCGADHSVQEWRGIFRQLYALGIATFETGDYGAWQMGEQGRPVLRGEEKVELRVNVLKAASVGTSRKREPAPLPIGVDADLLSALKAKRIELAKQQGVPAYVIFTDRTLMEIAAAKPGTLDQLAGLHGIGETKLERYGLHFLDVVAAQA